MKDKFTFVDLFSGIGGFRIPLEQLGGKCLGFSEIDKEAIKTYKSNFVKDDSEVELGDITKLNKLPFDSIDLIVGGVPCQSWSSAGKNLGFNDPRGKLWNDTIRMVELNKPKAFVFENVKGLADPRNKANLNLIVNSFNKIGYDVVSPKILNTNDFGLPQHRERIFIVGFRNDIELLMPFKYPKALTEKISLKDLLNINADKSDVPKHINKFFVLNDVRNGKTTIHSWDLVDTTKREKKICMTILRNRRKKIYGYQDGNPMTFNQIKLLIPNIDKKELDILVNKKILRKTSNKYSFVNSKTSIGINGIHKIFLPDSTTFATLTATHTTKNLVALDTIEYKDIKSYKKKFINEIYHKKKYRELTGKEYGKLQGFPDTFVSNESENQAKKQFGNSVSIPVVYHLMSNLIKTQIFNNKNFEKTSKKYIDNIDNLFEY